MRRWALTYLLACSFEANESGKRWRSKKTKQKRPHGEHIAKTARLTVLGEKHACGKRGRPFALPTTRKCKLRHQQLRKGVVAPSLPTWSGRFSTHAGMT